MYIYVYIQGTKQAVSYRNLQFKIGLVAKQV